MFAIAPTLFSVRLAIGNKTFDSTPPVAHIGEPLQQKGKQALFLNPITMLTKAILCDFLCALLNKVSLKTPIVSNLFTRLFPNNLYKHNILC